MNRRTLLGYGVGACIPTLYRSAASQDAPRLNHAALDKLGWRLCCQAWTFRQLSTYETIDTVSRLGIRYLEIYPGQRLSPDQPNLKLDHNLPAEHLDAVLARLKTANVRPMNYGVVGLPNDEAGARKVFDFARQLGLETIVSEPPEDAFSLLDRLCEEYRINVAIHDHPKPSHYWNPETVLKVTQGRSKRIGACADTGHWKRSGLVPVECMKMLEGRIISFHLKDLNEMMQDVPWGSGVCDIPGILKEAGRQKLRPILSIEYERTSGAELLSNVEKCRDYMSKLAGEWTTRG